MNTKPSTPFGHFFHSIGLWQPKLNGTIEEIYEQLHDGEKEAVKQASAWVAIVNENLDKAPSFVYDLIQSKFPDVTKEKVGEFLNKLNAEIVKADASVPATFDEAMGALQTYLSQYSGNTWAAITKAVVAVGTTILNPSFTAFQKIEFVLEYVYQTFVKGKV